MNRRRLSRLLYALTADVADSLSCPEGPLEEVLDHARSDDVRTQSEAARQNSAAVKNLARGRAGSD
jgi:hypothetical protein